jgi:CRISPR-associated endonuclease/helicase Cas3
MDVQEVYQRILGDIPYEHQQKAWYALTQGKSVILRAPTGSGKTEAVFLPFCCESNGQLPSRLIYTLPLRSLANQIERRLRDHAERLGKSTWRIALQHGQKPESVLFAADVVVATIDQVISSYACTPLTLPLRHGNIPAGAVAGSFLVFDEVHLFDPELALQAVQLICERLYHMGLPFAILSATLPDSVLDFFEEKLGCEKIDAQNETIEREVLMEFCDSELTVETVEDALKQGHRKVIIVVNTVERAINLFQQVRTLAERHGYAVNLLHARFLPEDRQEKERWVEENFGKNASEGKSILIATQVVEVGLDISADCLLTEIAPVDAIIQRAGRCARWGGCGLVKVFKVEKAAPYDENLVNRTEKVLSQDSNSLLTWEKAKEWVNEVLNDRYRQVLEQGTSFESAIARLSHAAFTGNRREIEGVVRDVQTVEVSLHSDPQSLGESALWLPTISVHIGVVKSWLKEGAKAWRLEVDREARDAGIQVRCEPISERNQREICLGDRLIFEPTKLAYNPQLGLHLGEGGVNFEPQIERERARLDITYQDESWICHALKTVNYMERVLERENLAVEGLARLLDISSDEVRRAGKFAALLHDLGKLTIEWQKRAGVSESASGHELLAHTKSRDYAYFPSHATVSAYALWCALEGVIPRQLGKAVLFAIAHHHSVRAKQVPSYRLHRSWQQAVKEALEQIGLDSDWLEGVHQEQPSTTDLRTSFPPLEYERLYTAYILVARWLRLADRMATEGDESAIFRYEDWFRRV